jgi:hypothetical protein
MLTIEQTERWDIMQAAAAAQQVQASEGARLDARELG